MDKPTQPVIRNKRPATSKGRFMQALALLGAAAHQLDNPLRRQVVDQYAGRHGKHNGRTVGAFGRQSS